MRAFILIVALSLGFSSEAVAQCVLAYNGGSAYAKNTSKTSSYRYRVQVYSKNGAAFSKKEGTLQPGQQKSVGRVNVSGKPFWKFKMANCKKL